MTALDWLPVLAFIAYAVTVGLRARGAASRNLEEYFLAGRGLRGWQAGISMAATQFAADTPLLVTGLIATTGIFGLWRLWVYALAFLMMGFLLAPAWRRARVLTDAELTELRYSGGAAAWLRALKAVYFGVVFNCAVLAMVLWAAREVVEPFLLWHAWLPEMVFEPVRALVEAVGVPFAREAAAGAGDLWVRSTSNLISIFAIVGVTLLYSATGGLRGVVRTDIGQFVVMMAATAVYAYVVVDAAGGLGSIGAQLEARFGVAGARELLAFTPDGARDVSFAVLAVLALQWLVQMNADGTGYLAQRSMACRTDRDATQAAVVFTFAQVLLRSLLWLPLGLGLLVLFPPDPALPAAALAADREATFVGGMIALLPPGALGLMLTAMLAALASTLDTHLNWGASYLTHDLYERFWCRRRGLRVSDRRLVWVARASNLLILLLALVILSQLSSIQVAWQLSLLLGAGMGVMLVLRWVWWRVTAVGELAAIGASLVLAPLLLLLPSELEAVRLLLMALGSTAAGVAATLIGPPEPRERLADFYARVRPPGFWGPFAAAAGEGPEEGRGRLVAGLTATVAAATTVFCWLTAAGSALVGSPAPAFFPWPVPWLVALVLVGALATPIWWRASFGRGRT